MGSRRSVPLRPVPVRPLLSLVHGSLMAFRANLEDVRLCPNITAGMNLLVVASLAYMMRTSREDPPPVSVSPEDGVWRLHDGRHRLVAAMIAGRPDVLCERTAQTHPEGAMPR
jgi:hypothetical protein